MSSNQGGTSIQPEALMIAMVMPAESLENPESNLTERDERQLTPEEAAAVDGALRRAALALWHTAISRSTRLAVADEIANGIAYYDYTFFREIPRLYAQQAHAPSRLRAVATPRLRARACDECDADPRQYWLDAHVGKQRSEKWPFAMHSAQHWHGLRGVSRSKAAHGRPEAIPTRQH
jgi:hypothetical protein